MYFTCRIGRHRVPVLLTPLPLLVTCSWDLAVQQVAVTVMVMVMVMVMVAATVDLIVILLLRCCLLSTVCVMLMPLHWQQNWTSRCDV